MTLTHRPGPARYHAQAGPRLWLNGAALQVIRESRGLTQQDLAHLVAMSTKHLGSLENGRRQTTPAVMAQLAQALGVRADAIAINLDRFAPDPVAS